MDVTDLIIVLEGSGSDLGSADKDVSQYARLEVSFDCGDEVLEIFVPLHVEASIPLSVFGGVRDKGESLIGHLLHRAN